jgi:hypothetical protein
MDKVHEEYDAYDVYPTEPYVPDWEKRYLTMSDDPYMY